jgi:hypothetical protein
MELHSTSLLYAALQGDAVWLTMREPGHPQILLGSCKPTGNWARRVMEWPVHLQPHCCSGKLYRPLAFRCNTSPFHLYFL